MGFVVGVIIVLLASRVIWKWLGLGRSGGPAERSNARGSFGLLLSRTYAYCLWISAALTGPGEYHLAKDDRVKQSALGLVLNLVNCLS